MNNQTESTGAPLELYRHLITGNGPTAHVSMTVGFSKDYGGMKVSANVSLVCDQNEATINRAGEYAFLKAVELVEDGWRELEKKLETAASEIGSR